MHARTAARFHFRALATDACAHRVWCTQEGIVKKEAIKIHGF
jgi:hypothetical protein